MGYRVCTAASKMLNDLKTKLEVILAADVDTRLPMLFTQQEDTSSRMPIADEDESNRFPALGKIRP